MPLISGLRQRGARVLVFTSLSFRNEVEAAGAEIVDLFRHGPLADLESAPLGFRCVSFAAAVCQQVAAAAKDYGLDLVLHEAFAVVGLAVARLLDIPYLCLCVGHNWHPEMFRTEAIRYYPRVNISQECHRALAELRTIEGLENIDEFIFAGSHSPYGNLCSEPRQYLSAEEKKFFEPALFFGSLSEPLMAKPARREPKSKFFIYVSFGTVSWNYLTPLIQDTLKTVIEALGGHPEIEVLVGLGNPPQAIDLQASFGNIRVERYADQVSALQRADLFITHNGMKSTHEAIYQEVPMLSYPLFGDQPGMARKCYELGLALPLAEEVQQPLTPAMVEAALARFFGEREAMQRRLASACKWETEVVENRPQVLDQIFALMTSAFTTCSPSSQSVYLRPPA